MITGIHDGPEEPSEYLKEMKLRHLITMSMGFESPMLMGVMRPQMVKKDPLGNTFDAGGLVINVSELAKRRMGRAQDCGAVHNSSVVRWTGQCIFDIIEGNILRHGGSHGL